MKKKNDQSAKPAFAERLRQRMRIQDEPRFHFILQLVFAFVQMAVAYIAFLSQNLSTGGMLLFGIYGALMMLLAGKGWQNRAARIAGRIVAAVTVLVFVTLLTAYTFLLRISEPIGTAFVDRTADDYAWQLLAVLAADLQPVLLMLFPTFVIAARRVGQRTDIRTLQIGGWSLVIMAVITLVLSYEGNRMFFGTELLNLNNRVLIYFYLLCTVASVTAVFLAYPYGTKWIKKRIERARGGDKATDKGERAS